MTSKFWLWMILSFILACATTAEQNTSVYNESGSTNLLEKVECACEKVKRCFHVGWEETLPFVNGLSINFVPAKRLKFLNKCTSEKIQTYCFKDKDDSIRGYIEPTDFREEFAELMFYENMAECFTREGWNVTSPIVKKIRFECAKELMKYNIQVIFKNFKPRSIIRQWNLAKAKEAYFKRYNEEFVETEISIESRAYSNMFNAFTIFCFSLTFFTLFFFERFERFQKNRQAPPSRIVLFRSGCDEGGYQSVLRYEKPVVTAICNKYAPGAPVTVIIPSKLHSFRFFKQDINSRDRADGQNIRPGTVLDEQVINSAYSEFFLNSHLALQGTAKTPKYTILFSSEKEVKLDLFERWTNALCYDFQIVTSPTSVPAPVYIAQRYAERGRQIWNTFITSDKANLDESGSNGNSSNGHGSDGSGSNGSGSSGSGNPDLNASLVNQFFLKSLDYNFTKKKCLRAKRVNA